MRPVSDPVKGPALLRFERLLRDATSSAFAEWLTFSSDLSYDGWRGDVAAVEKEGSARIGAKPCPAAIPHGLEDAETGEIRDVYALPCPSCGAAV